MVQGSTIKPFSRAREVAFRILFMLDQSGLKPAQILKQNEDLRDLSGELRTYVRKVVRGAFRKRQTLDALYAPHLTEWRLERISPVNRAILRLSLFEITERLIPVPVAINEAVELAKTYGTEDSPRFVNGILGTTVRELGLAEDPASE